MALLDKLRERISLQSRQNQTENYSFYSIEYDSKEGCVVRKGFRLGLLVGLIYRTKHALKYQI